MAVFFQIIGITIPFAGMIALVKRKQQSESSTRLLMATIGCLIINGAYLLFLTAKDSISAMTVLKMEYFGSSFFYFFLVLFLLSYLGIKFPEKWVYTWGAFECLVIGIYWTDRLRDQFFGRILLVPNARFHFMEVHVEQSTLYMVRYCALSSVLLAGLICAIVKMFKEKVKSDRESMAIIVGVQFVILVSLLIQILVNPPFDIVPMSASISILPVVISMHTDGFFGVKDWGYDWLFQQMEDVYIAVDCYFGLIDVNPSAIQVFPELDTMRDGDIISEEIKYIFNAEESVYKIGDKYYERNITDIVDNDEVKGKTILLRDITEQQKHLELAENYNIRLKEEVANKTRHIQLVQDSIITGIASVVESRDNSTGGHINRTSAVVKIFAKKIMETSQIDLSEEFLENIIKVAPMHDLGKVAVDDIVLRKPGKFTDEEYAKMKMHSAEGARVIGKVLAEVDDEEMTQTAVHVAHYHHERWDGKGYPNGLAGEEIPIESRIMALADVFDALVSKRCYKEAFEFDRAFSIVEEGLGTQFDPVLGKLFLECRPQLEQLYMEMG